MLVLGVNMWTRTKELMPYMHHLWVTPAVCAVKEIQHVLLELLAVLVNIFSGLFRTIRVKGLEGTT